MLPWVAGEHSMSLRIVNCLVIKAEESGGIVGEYRRYLAVNLFFNPDPD